MANIVFKVGTLDLSNFVRVSEKTLNLGQGDMIEPAFSDSPFFEGQYLTSVHAKNKELQIPLFLHPPTAPYTQDALNQLIQQVNQALRPIVDLGQVVNAEWKNAQASNSTFFTIQYGRFDPDFTFRITEKGWLAGVLHLWVLPYGHTATQRSLGTYAAPANQSGIKVEPASMLNAGGTVVGDVPPQFELLTTVGSYLGDDGRIGIHAALPVPSYTPIIPVGSFFGLAPSAVIQGASGAWASQYLAIDPAVGSQAYFSIALSPASVYAGDNRVLGLVRARRRPFGLRAFDALGNALGPTVIASAMDGWQLVDYGIFRPAPWGSTQVITVQAYTGIPYNASGMFAPPRPAPGWTKEHGPIFVLPNSSTLLDLDWNSQTIAADGFDGPANTLPINDQLGNAWLGLTPASICPTYCGLTGSSGFVSITQLMAMPVSTSVTGQDFEAEAVLTFPSNASGMRAGVGLGFATSGIDGAVVRWDLTIGMQPSGAWFSWDGNLASVAIPSPLSGQYHVKTVWRNSLIYSYMWGPSGAYPGSASGIPLTIAAATVPGTLQNPATPMFPGIRTVGVSNNATVIFESFRAKFLASQGIKSRDILHLHQPNVYNARANPSAIDMVDLQSRQRGAIQAPQLPVPSLGAGLFVASFPWDQGPANDLLNVDVRVRERFTYAR